MEPNQQTQTSNTNTVLISMFTAAVTTGVFLMVQMSVSGTASTNNVNNAEPVASNVEPTTTYPTPETIMAVAEYSIGGTVVSVSNEQIVFERNPDNPLTANITDTTTIVAVVPKTPEELEAEAEAMRVSLQNPDNLEDLMAQLPPPPEEETITISDIKVGDIIVVTTSENLENLTEFTAAGVKVMPN